MSHASGPYMGQPQVYVESYIANVVTTNLMREATAVANYLNYDNNFNNAYMHFVEAAGKGILYEILVLEFLNHPYSQQADQSMIYITGALAKYMAGVLLNFSQHCQVYTNEIALIQQPKYATIVQGFINKYYAKLNQQAAAPAPAYPLPTHNTVFAQPGVFQHAVNNVPVQNYPTQSIFNQSVITNQPALRNNPLSEPFYLNGDQEMEKAAHYSQNNLTVPQTPSINPPAYDFQAAVPKPVVQVISQAEVKMLSTIKLQNCLDTVFGLDGEDAIITDDVELIMAIAMTATINERKMPCLCTSLTIHHVRLPSVDDEKFLDILSKLRTVSDLIELSNLGQLLFKEWKAFELYSWLSNLLSGTALTVLEHQYARIDYDYLPLLSEGKECLEIFSQYGAGVAETMNDIIVNTVTGLFSTYAINPQSYGSEEEYNMLTLNVKYPVLLLPWECTFRYRRKEIRIPKFDRIPGVSDEIFTQAFGLLPKHITTLDVYGSDLTHFKVYRGPDIESDSKYAVSLES